MRLPGNLRSTTLGDLLGMLHREGSSGTLELVEDRGLFAGRSHRVHLVQGMVENVETALPVARLGELLTSEGLVSKPVVERAVAETCHGARARLGQLLLRDSALSNEVLVAALRYQLRRRLDSLFTLRHAMVRFRVPRPRRSGERPIPLSPREFLFGRPRSRLRSPGSAAPARRFASSRSRALATLGLEEQASPEQIRRAFRLLAQQTHPDRFPTATAAERRRHLQRFAELSAAYHLLMA